LLLSLVAKVALVSVVVILIAVFHSYNLLHRYNSLRSIRNHPERCIIIFLGHC
jgi:hypothetical protein